MELVDASIRRGNECEGKYTCLNSINSRNTVEIMAAEQQKSFDKYRNRAFEDEKVLPMLK